MFIVHLNGNTLHESPQWWQNFINDFCDNIDNNISDKKYEKLLINELKKYKAVIMTSNVPNIINSVIFDDEKYYTAFLLKWS